MDRMLYHDLVARFRNVWMAAAIEGICDALDSAEYQRVLVLWEQAKFATPISFFIRQHANAPVSVARMSVTRTKCPFVMPDLVQQCLHYPNERQLVRIWWEEAGDELAWDDGRRMAVGISNHWPYLDWIRSGKVWGWMLARNIDLGTSDSPPNHNLILDRGTNSLYVAPVAEARTIVVEQALPADLVAGG